MATARRATKLTMMVTGGDDDNNGDGATGYDSKTISVTMNNNILHLHSK
jgi:hypothetical protein